MKQTMPAIPVAPTSARLGVTEATVMANLRFVDAATGQTIERVIEADADAGTVRRFEVTNGNLVREGDSFLVVDEVREIRIEWIDPAAAAGAAAGEGEAA